jgi:hypothetical protein
VRFAYDVGGDLTHLDRSVQAWQAAVGGTATDDLAEWYTQLSAALEILGSRTGSLERLDAAVAADRNAVTAATGGERDPSEPHAALSQALWARYALTQRISDLDEMIEVARESMALSPPTQHRPRSQTHVVAYLSARRRHRSPPAPTPGAPAASGTPSSRPDLPSAPSPDAPDCGSGVAGAARRWELPDDADQPDEDLPAAQRGLGPDEAALLRAQVARDLRAARCRRPSGLRRWAEDALRSLPSTGAASWPR